MDNEKLVISISYDGKWKCQGDSWSFKGKVRTFLTVPKNIGYSELLAKLYTRLKLDETLFELKLKVLLPSDGGVQAPPSLIVDDEDVEGYICVASRSRIVLCVTLVQKDILVDSSDKNGDGYDTQENEANTEYSGCCAQVFPDFPPIENVPQIIPTSFVQQQYFNDTAQPNFEEYVDVAPAINPNLNAPHFTGNANLYSQTQVPDLNSTPVEEFDGHRIDPTNEGGVYVHINSSTPGTRTSRHSGKGSDHNFILQSFSREDISAPVAIGPSNSERTEDLYVGQVFESKQDLKKKLNLHAMRNNFEFRVRKSSQSLWYITCIDNNCKWRLRAIQLDGSDMFNISALKNEHTCGMDVRQNDHRQAAPWVVGHLIKKKYNIEGPKHLPRNIMTDIQNDYGIQMSYEKAWRCREKAVEYVRGNPEDAYPKLPSYLAMLQKKNPGTLCDITQEEDGRFKYCYMAIGACIRGFQFCRPVICVDGSHLKTRYHGHMLCAVALDADDHLVPLAFAIVDSENNDSWSYFMDRLKQTIGIVADLVFVSDRHASIQHALHRFFPEAHHGFCYQHIIMNVNAKFKNDHCKAEMSAAAYAYRKSECNRHLQKIHEKDPAVAAYLREIGLEKWCRSYFPGKRYDILTSNYAESFNNTTREARKMPVTTLLEFIRFTAQDWFCVRRELADKCTSRLSPKMEEKLRGNHDRARFFHPHCLNYTQFHVIDERGNVEVDIGDAKRCDCGVFQLIGIPCEHAVAAAMTRRVVTYTLCSPYYTSEYWKSTYADTIYPCDNVDEWDVPVEIANMNVSVPIPRTSVGRPKKTGRIKTKRIPSQGENVSSARKCSRCQNVGHNRAKCKV